MHNLKEKSINFLKDETILAVSIILAIISSFFVKPNINYLNYINWETILLLLTIMFIVEILKNLTVFEKLVRKLLLKIGNTRQLLSILILISFISSIFITNDVSLIIFVPFAITALKKVFRADLIIITVSLQTIAANVGCMILPIGAPHNIVMYTTSNISIESFFLLLVPYIAISLIFLLTITLLVPKDEITIHKIGEIEFNRKHFITRVIKGVDYYLILTFIALFILIGNLKNMAFFSTLFKSIIIGNEVISGVALSQIISNVPAAMLLSGFSNNYQAIIIGINIGGFGSLIASMANLISYNIILRQCNEYKVRYLIIFTILNVLLLAILIGVNMVI